MCKAQTPLSCQLCSIQKDIKWKCTECALLMCDNCKINVHSRIKTADKHNVITIEEVGKDLSERLKALHISDVFSTVFNTYTPGLGGIHKLICCADDTIYFSNYGDNRRSHLTKAKLLKASVKILQNFDIACFDFAISFKEDILFNPLPGTKLIAMSMSTLEKKTIVEASPLLIVAIHMSKHDELLIGLRDQGPKYPVTNFSTRRVDVFGTDYKHKKTFDRDVKGDMLFNYTRRITTDSVNNIYVVDWFDDDERVGRIVSIDRNGRTRFFYNGCAAFNTHDAAFNPEDIAVTSRNTTIISDSNNHALHALSTDGKLIGLQIIKNLDILYPCSLSVDDEGFLLIGSSEDNNPKICVVKLLP